MKNDYDSLSSKYIKSNEKPDKKYSMLPTVLKLFRPLKNKIIIDVGCGDGFFTIPIAEKAKFVYGIDNSKEQINKVPKLKNVKFKLINMFDFKYPRCDGINCPYVLGYVRTEKELEKLFSKFYKSLNKNGKLVGIIDFPKSKIHNNKAYGSIKKLSKFEEGAKLSIELYGKNKKLITLKAYFHTKEFIDNILKKLGFSVNWVEPIISKKGIKKYGKEYWNKYLKNCDVAYFVAKK